MTKSRTSHKNQQSSDSDELEEVGSTGQDNVRIKGRREFANSEYIESDAVHIDANLKPSFISRLGSIPLVADSVTAIKGNKYGRFAVETAETTFNTVTSYTEPYHPKLVKSVASKSLDIIEENFPIIKEPTTEIVKKVKQPFVPAYETSMQAYTNIQSTIDARVTVPAQTVAKDINTRVTPLVDNLEAVVNRFLPVAEENGSAPTTDGSIEVNQAVRAVSLIGRDVPKRIRRRLSVSALPQSAQDLLRIKETSALLNKTTDSVNALLEALKKNAKDIHDNVHSPRDVPVVVQQKLVELTANLQAEIEYLKAHMPKLPEYLQGRIDPLVIFLNERYDVVKTEINKPDVAMIQKAKNIIKVTTDETLPILQQAGQEIKDTLTHYQTTLNANVTGTIRRAKEVNARLNDAAVRSFNSVRSTLTVRAQ